MKESLYKKLFALKSDQESIELVIKDKEEKLKPLLDELKQLKSQIVEVKELIVEDLKSNNVKTYDYEGNNIVRASRSTLSIFDENAALKQLTENDDIISKIKKLTGLKVGEIREKVSKVMLNKDNAKDFADALLKVDNIMLDGFEMKETEYLTIK